MDLQLTTIMARPEHPPTPESIAAAKRLNAQERAACTKETGLQFDADGHPVLPVKDVQRMACKEAVDALVEEFGFSAVLRALGYLRVTTEDEADRG